jgi:hypothetical protein
VVYEWYDDGPAQALSDLSRSNRVVMTGAGCLRSSGRKEAFLGKAELQRAVLHPCSAILHLGSNTRGDAGKRPRRTDRRV